MPTPTPSAYELDRNQRRDADRRERQQKRLVGGFRQRVEKAISLNRAAVSLEKTNENYDQDKDGLQQRAAADRAAWWSMLVFSAAVFLYVIGEFFASGDVAEWLAHQIAPLFVDAHGADAPASTPIWLRRTAGAGFVAVMLGVTLVLKYVTTHYAHRLSARRERVAAGDAATYRGLTFGIWLNHGAKAAYIAAVAVLYVWLFGFAQERAAFTAAIAAEQKAVEALDLGIKIEGGEVQTSGTGTAPVASDGNKDAVGHKLAYATGVIYVCLWLLHGLVLLLPTEGFGRELPFAHYKRGAAGRTVESLRESEERTLRDILERIHRAEGGEREVLIREAQPVRKRLIEAAGGNPDSGNPPSAAPTQPTAPPDEPEDGSAGPVPFPNPTDPSGPRPSGASVPAADDVYEAIFGSRAA